MFIVFKQKSADQGLLTNHINLLFIYFSPTKVCVQVQSFEMSLCHIRGVLK